nr:MAG TPA: hypothetical protein [Caudoviricetes sp.]
MMSIRCHKFCAILCVKLKNAPRNAPSRRRGGKQ